MDPMNGIHPEFVDPNATDRTALDARLREEPEDDEDDDEEEDQGDDTDDDGNSDGYSE
jgi:hypothetical protein